jgi:hypothetical protein
VAEPGAAGAGASSPGDQVQVRGVGGHLHWDDECGSLWVESARSFPLLLDGEPAGTLTCYAGGCSATTYSLDGDV